MSWKAIFWRRNITEKYFIRVSVRGNMLSDDDDADDTAIVVTA